jgi:hypothetical protein
MPSFVSALEHVASFAEIWDNPMWLILVLLLWALSGMPGRPVKKQGQPVKSIWWTAAKRAYSRASKSQRIVLGGVATAAVLMSAFNVANSYGFKDWLIFHNLTEIEHVTYVNQEVTLDGFSYRHCVFDHVTFVYNGAPFRIADSTITAPTITSSNKLILSTGWLLHSFRHPEDHPGVPQ